MLYYVVLYCDVLQYRVGCCIVSWYEMLCIGALHSCALVCAANAVIYCNVMCHVRSIFVFCSGVVWHVVMYCVVVRCVVIGNVIQYASVCCYMLYSLLYYVMSCVVLCRIMWCCGVLCVVGLCRIQLRFVMLCCVVLGFDIM